jgi:amino acid transporter
MDWQFHCPSITKDLYNLDTPQWRFCMSSSSTSPANEGQLGLFDAISIIVGIVIGTSIFYVPHVIFAVSSDPWMGLAVWTFGGLLALIGALCYAELATTYPRSGGDYVYLTRAFGPATGFLFGWAQLTVVFAASIGAMAHVFASYATRQIYDLGQIPQLADLGLSSEFVYAALAIVLLTLFNIVGVGLGKWTQNLLTLAKVAGLGGILVVGFFWAKSSPLDWQPAPWRDLGWGSLAIILVLYAYGGWNDAAFVAAEVRNRQRNIPLALILGVGAITIIYLLVNAAYLMGLGPDVAKNKSGLPALLLRETWGETGEKAISILIMISALGAVNGLIFTGARIYATLGSDHRLFGWLGHWQPGRRPPILSLLAQGIITVAILYILTSQGGHNAINQLLTSIGIEHESTWKPDSGFEILVSHTAPVFWTFFLLTGLALFVLREKNPGLARPFSVPLYPLLPLIFCNMCAYMLYQSVKYVGVRAGFAFCVVLAGLPFFLLSRLMGGPKGKIQERAT